MNKNPDWRISHSLDLLARLKRTAAEFAQRETQLIRDAGARRQTAQRQDRDAGHQAEQVLASRLEAVDAQHQGEQAGLVARGTARRQRVQALYRTKLGNVQAEAKRAKEKFLGELQLRHLNAKRNLPVDIEAADARYAAFSGLLKEARSSYVSLERRAAFLFSGYGALKKLLRREPVSMPDPSAEPAELLEVFRGQLQSVAEQLKKFSHQLLPASFRAVPLFGMLALALAAGGVAAIMLRQHPAMPELAAAVGGGLAVLILLLYRVGLSQARPAAEAIAFALAGATRQHDFCRAAAKSRHQEEHRRLQENFDALKTEIESEWKRGSEIERDFSRATVVKLEEQIPRVLDQAERLHQVRLARQAEKHRALRQHLVEEAEARQQQRSASLQATLAKASAEETALWADLAAIWREEISPLYAELHLLQDAAAERIPAWDASLTASWQPATEFTPAANFGRLELDLARTGAPRDPRLPLPGSPQISLPLTLAFPEQGTLLIESPEASAPEVAQTLNNLILRLLVTMPPGKVAFTILDPVGLGQDFAGLMHLADYEDSIINRRIWTQHDQIDERLSELNEHIEKVIQMYLRNEFATIADYNAQAGSVAEKYHFLIVAGLPASFTENTARRLRSILLSGPRCGVFTLLHRDVRLPLPDGLDAEELRRHSVTLCAGDHGLTLHPEAAQSGASLVLDPPPGAELAASLVHRIGKASIDSNRVQVPFDQITPPPAERWTGDTTSELKVAIGRTGATKLQMLAIGKGTRQHALFAGKTGSGKSTLFHVIITNLALTCSPDQVEFYLIDFKKGVEFKCYATHRLPHARVIAIESDREFGLSVLQRVDEELKRRGDLFRKLGVQDIPGYKRAGGAEPMPRSLLIIDEFQEFFVEDDAIAQSASLLFDRIVRQGRAFGIHVLLGSQTLGGAYSLARATLGQMVIRVALQCNEADAYLIMDESNSAPRLLSRPGEGIYNDAAGAVEGNSPFQVVWLPDDERDAWLSQVRTLAAEHHDHHPSPIVFEGNAPADLRENDLLNAALASAPTKRPPAPRCWLGAPNSIKGPTEAIFRRQSGNHLMIVGQRDEAALTMLGLSLLALAAQHPAGTAKFYFIHSATPGSAEHDLLERLLSLVPQGVTVAGPQTLAPVLEELAVELKSRASGEATGPTPAVFLFIHGLHRCKKLRQEDDFSFSSGDGDSANPGAQFNELIVEGSGHGLHLLVSLDTFNNVNRALSRKAQSEFEMRVVFQMSANDSASLIDSPKASALGLHRAIFANEQEAQLETFRPYAPPDEEWLREVGEKLALRKIPAHENPAASTADQLSPAQPGPVA